MLASSRSRQAQNPLARVRTQNQCVTRGKGVGDAVGAGFAAHLTRNQARQTQSESGGTAPTSVDALNCLKFRYPWQCEDQTRTDGLSKPSWYSNRRPIVDLRMPSLPVVEDLNAVEDRVRQIEPSSPLISVQQFDLPSTTRRIPSLRCRTRRRWSRMRASGHRTNRIGMPGRELNSMIGVHKPAGRWFSILDRHIQGIHYQGHVLAVIDRPADGLPAERVLSPHSSSLFLHEVRCSAMPLIHNLFGDRR